MDFLNYNSVETLPGFEARAAFTVNSASVFREDVDIVPTIIDDTLSYVPWEGDNQMPFDLLALVEKDETLATCQVFNAEVCYGSGLQYCATGASAHTQTAVEDFTLDNDLAAYFLGICQDFKHFGFAVSVLILNEDGTKIVRLLRKEACYCRFAPADKQGRIPKILYANWRKAISARSDIEEIDLLDITAPWRDLQDMLAKKSRVRKFAIVSRIPTVDSTYYPIPYYGALFRGKWYNIKQLIGIAKEAKLRNSAPIKYHIEVGAKYWESIFRAEGITDRRKQQERIVQEKQPILDFLTGAENSGKAWFSTFYVTPDGKEQHDVVINKIDSTKEGGDWETDIQEAINMICFTMRVHSNLVGSVPGKAQSNNSGSDKRELYTIAQALQKPYHDLLFTVHRIIIRFNGWQGVHPEIPFIQLTTLDEHQDAKQVTLPNSLIPMKLITTDEQLRSHLPNIIASVKGETPLIERLALFLDLAEDWVVNTFTSTSTFNTICGYTDTNPIKVLTSRLVVADALRRAIPSLDIVLTPNGFAVVNTSNLAPASKPRVDRLVGSMLAHRDDCIAALLPELVGASKWLASEQASFFGATLFPTLEIVDSLAPSQGSRWEKYLELRSQVIDLEASLAEEWLSPELMSALRSENLRSDLTEKRKRIVEQVKSQIVGYLRGGSFNARRLADIVNYIRQDEVAFGEWHKSETAKLFAPPIFRNQKKSAGYFF